VVVTQVTRRSGAVRHETSGEPDVKWVNKEMENQPTEINMMVLFERMLQEQRAQPTGSYDRFTVTSGKRFVTV
jgi:hypothetical protein